MNKLKFLTLNDCFTNQAKSKPKCKEKNNNAKTKQSFKMPITKSWWLDVKKSQIK